MGNATDLNLFGEPGQQRSQVTSRYGLRFRPPLHVVCGRCGTGFVHTKGVDGTKYCADCQGPAKLEQTGKWHKDHADRAPCACDGCGTEHPWDDMRRGKYTLCPSCATLLKHVYQRLCKHRVPVGSIDERGTLRQLVADPSCPVCKEDVLEMRRNDRGEWIVDMVVDHNSGCCPGSSSCGKCVEGFVHGGCNIAAGQVKHDARIAYGLGDYLIGRTVTITRPVFGGRR